MENNKNKGKKEIIIAKFKTEDNNEKTIKYIKGKLIVKGGFSETYEFLNQENSKIYAGKIISLKNSKFPNSRELFLNEVNILKNLNHKNVAKLDCYFEDCNNCGL